MAEEDNGLLQLYGVGLGCGLKPYGLCCTITCLFLTLRNYSCGLEVEQKRKWPAYPIRSAECDSIWVDVNFGLYW